MITLMSWVSSDHCIDLLKHVNLKDTTPLDWSFECVVTGYSYKTSFIDQQPASIVLCIYLAYHQYWLLLLQTLLRRWSSWWCSCPRPRSWCLANWMDFPVKHDHCSYRQLQQGKEAKYCEEKLLCFKTLVGAQSPKHMQIHVSTNWFSLIDRVISFYMWKVQFSSMAIWNNIVS